MPIKNKNQEIFPTGINRQFAKELRQARKRHQLTQAELANKVGLKQSSIAKIESSKADIATQRFLEICRVLGYDVVLIPTEKLAAVRAILKPQQEREAYSEFKDLLGVREEGEDSDAERSESKNE